MSRVIGSVNKFLRKDQRPITSRIFESVVLIEKLDQLKHLQSKRAANVKITAQPKNEKNYPKKIVQRKSGKMIAGFRSLPRSFAVHSKRTANVKTSVQSNIETKSQKKTIDRKCGKIYIAPKEVSKFIAGFRNDIGKYFNKIILMEGQVKCGEMC